MVRLRSLRSLYVQARAQLFSHVPKCIRELASRASLLLGALDLSVTRNSTAATSLLASERARQGQGYVAAQVFGNPDAAKARKQFIVPPAAPADVPRCQPILDSLGQRTFVIGADPQD